MTTILDGKKLSQEILNELKIEVSKLQNKPHLVVILVGDNPASKIYVGMKKKKAEDIGIESTIISLPADTKESVLLEKIKDLNNDKSVHAVLVQLPLPKHIDTQKVIQAIDPKKDVDGFTPENVGRISIGIEPYAYPCTPKGVIMLLDTYGIEIAGKHAVIVGRSNIVGKPLSQMLLNKNATVTVCHSQTKNLSSITKTADILISAVGKNKIITGDCVKSDAVVVDVGICRENEKICGDIDFSTVESIASFITPVPGGVGPMTIACLMVNTYTLYKLLFTNS